MRCKFAENVRYIIHKAVWHTWAYVLCGPPQWLSGKESAFSAGDARDMHLIPGSERFPGVEDAIQPSGPLPPPTVSALNPSQHQGLLKLQYTANMISMYTVVYCGICFIVVV